MFADIHPTYCAGRQAIRMVDAAGDSVTILLRGAQVMSWMNADGQELLYQSPLPPAHSAAPLRAGIPLVFPQFGTQGPLPKHGFARTAEWRFVNLEVIRGNPQLKLRLHSDAASYALWPYAFQLELKVLLAPGSLQFQLDVHNCGQSRFEFQAALHPYFRVKDIATARLALVSDGQFQVAPVVPQDLVCHDVDGLMYLQTPQAQIEMCKTGFADYVVWNPGPDATLADLPPQDYRRFVCVEPAAVKPVQLMPGAHWLASHTLRWRAVNALPLRAYAREEAVTKSA